MNASIANQNTYIFYLILDYQYPIDIFIVIRKYKSITWQMFQDVPR